MVIENIYHKRRYNVTPEQWAAMSTKKTFRVVEEDKPEQTIKNTVKAEKPLKNDTKQTK